MYEVTYILGGNIELNVQFKYTPGKPMVYGQTNETSEPAEDEEIEIKAVTCNGRLVDTDDIGIFNKGSYDALDDEIEQFISENLSDWWMGEPEE